MYFLQSHSRAMILHLGHEFEFQNTPGTRQLTIKAFVLAVEGALQSLPRYFHLILKFFLAQVGQTLLYLARTAGVTLWTHSQVLT